MILKSRNERIYKTHVILTVAVGETVGVDDGNDVGAFDGAVVGELVGLRRKKYSKSGDASIQQAIDK